MAAIFWLSELGLLGDPYKALINKAIDLQRMVVPGSIGDLNPSRFHDLDSHGLDYSNQAQPKDRPSWPPL
jgi:hypothetical protein